MQHCIRAYDIKSHNVVRTASHCAEVESERAFVIFPTKT